MPDIVTGNEVLVVGISGFEVIRGDPHNMATEGKLLMKCSTSTSAHSARSRHLWRDVKITITPLQLAVLDRAIPEILPALEYQRRRFEVDGPLGWMESEQIETLYGFDFRGRPAVPVGLLARLKRVLREHGYRVMIDDQRKTKMPLDPIVLASLQGRERALVRAMAKQPMGRIEVASDERATCVFSMLNEAFPDTRFVVAAASTDRAVTLWNLLHKAIEEKPGLAVPGRRFTGERWAVGTPWKLAAGVRPDDVLLLPDAEKAVGDRVVEWVIRMEFERCYAFVRPGRQYDRRVQLRLEQLAGPLIHRVAWPRVPVHVAMLPSPIGPISTGAGTALSQKRERYWLHAARNDYIAHVAKSVAARHPDELCRLGLADFIDNATGDRLTRVAVIVECPQHGREIATRLPGWPLLSAMRIPAEDRDQGCEPALNVIATTTIARERGIRADVVIRATGTEWPLRIKNFQPKLDKQNVDGVVLIDFQDDFHPGAIRDAERRQADYLRRGYQIVERPAIHRESVSASTGGLEDLPRG